MEGSPLVTIQCLTYNHEKYIRKCLDGFVMQKTNFRFEAIVHDDASTDGTANIVREYADKYPDIIKPIFETENQYSKSDGSLNRIMYEHTLGKYIALCEGDDYWTDPYKLQKQVDYLEQHDDVVCSCHRYQILYDQTNEIELATNIYFDNHPAETSFEFDLSYPYSKEWITKTLTVLFRKDAAKNLDIKEFKYFRDIHLIFSLLSHGKGICHSFIGGVYRKNKYSVYGSLTRLSQIDTDIAVYSELYNKTNYYAFKQLLFHLYDQKLFLKRRTRFPLTKIEWEWLLCHIPHKIILKITKILKE